jgi:mono/diheme cytochrome c family protein
MPFLARLRGNGGRTRATAARSVHVGTGLLGGLVGSIFGPDMIRGRPALIVLCGIIAFAPIAHAADVAKGHKLAESVCSRCHGVTTHKKGWTSAPSFAEIANSPTTTSGSLEATIQTPHAKMSGSAARTPSEAADLAAYILSLRRK